jgi:ribosomal protein S18 acetylase RimI-like enzyme
MLDVRIATQIDIPTIQQIANQTWFDTYTSILSEDQLDYMFEMMYSSRSLRTQMEEGHTFYMAYYNNKPCGYVSIEHDTDNIFHLQKLYVDPSFQGLGIGKTLLHTAFKHACKECEEPECIVELNVNRNNKALEFYKKMGMEINRQGDFPIGSGFCMCDYIMRIKLDNKKA